MKYLILTIISLALTTGANSQELTNRIQQLYTEVVTAEGLVDYTKVDRSQLSAIANEISTIDLATNTKSERTAFYINAYNVLVMHKVATKYPAFTSVDNDSGFFKDKNLVAGEQIGLDALEKKILQLYPSGHIHMALICGAVSCPPFPSEAFTGANLDEQLQAQSRKAVESSTIVNTSTGKISSIFNWYSTDFQPNVREWISTNGGPELKKLSYQAYDWSLNDASVKSSGQLGNRYYASNLYSRGSYEVSSFNNYYSQTVGDRQSDWFTSTSTFLIGVNKRLNVGLDIRYRATQQGQSDRLGTLGGLFVFGESTEQDTAGETVKAARAGVSAIGLRVKYQPVKTISNFTIQHIVYIPTISNGNKAFLDWESPYIISDAYYDKTIGKKSALFASLGLHIENINSAFFRSSNGYYQVSTPVTGIYSYFPSDKSTLYFLANAAPRWGYNITGDGSESDAIWDPYGQVGVGFKYFLFDNFQVEVLYTQFFGNQDDFLANTINFGTRYYAW